MVDLASVRVLISGQVQGVGFRYFVTSSAERFNITGYVRNLDTGGVELEVEGEKKEIYKFLLSIRVGPTNSHITNFQTEWKPYQEKYDTFFVKFV